MDYFETAVLVAVGLVTLSVMGAVLYDIGKDVMKAARKDSKRERAQAKLPDNVIRFSREKRKRTRAIDKEGVR